MNSASDHSSPEISRGVAPISEHIFLRMPAFSFREISNGLVMVMVPFFYLQFPFFVGRFGSFVCYFRK